MTVIDLTHDINPQMPVYPGTEPPVFKAANTYEQDGFAELLITMFSHTGTHLDVPRHLFRDGLPLDAMPVNTFVGKGLVIDGRNESDRKPLSMDSIGKVKALADEADFLLFNWGWDEYWGADGYFSGYPCIGADVADYIIESGKKGIGVDSISVDPVSDSMLTIHRRLLKSNVIIIENLRNLAMVGTGLFTFAALPLKISGGDGAPARAVAMLD